MARLRRELGVLDVTAITSGIIIGAGLFIVTGLGAKYAGSWVWLSYLIGAIPVILIGLTTANLSTFYPVETGAYVYPSRIIHPIAGFLSGWAMFFGMISPVAITAGAFISYVNALPGVETGVPIVAGSIGVIAVFFALNYFGIKLVSRVQNVLYIGLIGGLLIFMFWGLPHVDGSLLSLAPPHGVGGIMKGASILIFSYAGLSLACDIGEETKNPARTLPLGIGIGVLIPIIVYVVPSLVCVGVVPWESFAESPVPFVTAAEAFMGPAGIIFVCVVAWLATLSSHNGEQAMAARIGFGLSRDKIISGLWARLNRYGIPHVALITAALVAVLLIVTGGLELLACMTVAMFLVEWLCFHISVIMAQKKFPEMYQKSGFKLDGWKLIVPILGIGITVYALYLQGGRALGFGAIWLAIGALIYFVGMRVGDKEEIKKLLGEWPAGRYIEEVK